MKYNNKTFHWCLSFKHDLTKAILCWCSPEIKAMSPSHPPQPPRQGQTHHHFNGLSAQVMHGSYSSQSEAVFITNYVRQQPTHHIQALGILGPSVHSSLFCFMPSAHHKFLFLNLFECRFSVRQRYMQFFFCYKGCHLFFFFHASLSCKSIEQ